MPQRRLNLITQETPKRTWAPLIGARFAAKLAPLAALFLAGAIVMLGGLIGMLILIGLSRTSPLSAVAGFAVGGIGVAAWAIPYVLIDRLGVQMGNALRDVGIITDRRPPIHNQRLYKQWLSRNGLTAAQVCAAIDRIPPR